MASERRQLLRTLITAEDLRAQYLAPCSFLSLNLQSDLFSRTGKHPLVVIFFPPKLFTERWATTPECRGRQPRHFHERCTVQIREHGEVPGGGRM